MSTLPDSIVDLIERTKTDGAFKRRVAEHQKRVRDRYQPAARKSTHAYEHRHPDRVSVRKAVMWAVKRGKLIRPTECACDGVHDGPIQAHHINGYAWENRFDIIWVCRRHHHIIEKLGRQKPALLFDHRANKKVSTNSASAFLLAMPAPITEEPIA